MLTIECTSFAASFFILFFAMLRTLGGSRIGGAKEPNCTILYHLLCPRCIRAGGPEFKPSTIKKEREKGPAVHYSTGPIPKVPWSKDKRNLEQYLAQCRGTHL
jgi:hypothetical protein